MGCSYDILSARIRPEHKKKFIKMFNKILEDDLYDDWCVADDDCFAEDEMTGDGRLLFSLDQEPVFTRMENGAQWYDFICKQLNEVKDDGFTADYECTFNNCGAMVIDEYEYANGKLKVHSKYAEEGSVYECPECGHDDEDELSLHAWSAEKGLVCPKCGAQLELDDASEEFEEVDVAEYCKEAYEEEPYPDWDAIEDDSNDDDDFEDEE